MFLTEGTFKTTRRMNKKKKEYNVMETCNVIKE